MRALVVLVTPLVAALAAAAPAQRAYASTSARLLVVSSDVHAAGSRELLLLDSFGHERRRLTRHDPQGVWPSWSPDGRTIAFLGVHESTSDHLETEGLWIVPADGGSPKRLFAKRDTAAPAWSPDGRRLLFTVDGALWMIDRDGRHARRISPLSFEVLGAAWSRDGRMIAASDYRGGKLGGGVSVARADGRGWRRITRPASRHRVEDENDLVFGVSWSPGDKEIAFSRGFLGEGAPLLEVAAASGGRERVIGHGVDPHWSPDGRTIAFVGVVGSYAPNRAELVRADGTGRRAFADAPGIEWALAWSRDGSGVVFATGDGASLKRWTIGTRNAALRALTPSRIRAFRGVVGNDWWSPDGDFALERSVPTAPNDPNVDNSYDQVIDVARLGGARRQLLHPAVDSDPVWSPDGTRIAFTRRIGAQSTIVTTSIDKREARGLVEGTSPLWAPDGNYIAFQQGAQIGLVRPDGTHAHALTSGASPAWSPDGRSLAVVRDGVVWIIDVDTGATRRLTADLPPLVIDDPEQRCVPKSRTPAWSPSGQSIAFVDGCGSFERLFVVAADGARPRQIFETDDVADTLAFSPDGAWIVYSNDYWTSVLTSDGSEVLRDYRARSPAWAPEGGMLAVVVDRPSRGSDLWTMAPDGNREQRLTRRAFNDEPAWQPLSTPRR